MIRLLPISTRTDTLVPYTALFRSHDDRLAERFAAQQDDPRRVAPCRNRALRRSRCAVADVRGRDLDAIERGAAGVHEHRSEEHTSELQSLMRTSSAVICLTKLKPRYSLTTLKPHCLRLSH